MDFTCNDGALTLKKYATRILGNGHSIETDRAIIAEGEGTRVDLGKPDGTDTLTVNVNADVPTLAIDNGAEMNMYDGVTVNHKTKQLSAAAIQLHNESSFYMHDGQVSDCFALNGVIVAEEKSHVEIHGGEFSKNELEGGSGGGTIRLAGKSSLDVDGNVVFENNKTHNRGVAVHKTCFEKQIRWQLSDKG